MDASTLAAIIAECNSRADELIKSTESPRVPTAVKPLVTAHAERLRAGAAELSERSAELTKAAGGK